jgi:hypothetical protein|tara:strand:- start:101 stop:427 length:327 start_codon:yes stop_codon:yes gene_type:complete
MPTYNFYNEETKEEFEGFMKMSQLDQYKLDNPHIKQRPNLVAFVGDHITLTAKKIDGGFHERLEQIAHSNPNSPLADRYGGSTTSIKDVKTREVIKKHGVLDRMEKYK